MNFLVRIIATALIAASAILVTPSVALAAEVVDPPPNCYTDAEVHSLEIDLIEAEHDAHTLRATLEEERDEHADELRRLDRVAWDTQQAHEDEVNTFSALAHAAERKLLESEGDVAQRDTRIARLQSKVQRLRDMVRAAR